MDPNSRRPGELRRRRYPKRDTERRYRRFNVVDVDQDATLADLLETVREHAPDVDPTQLRVNWATLSWEDDATEKEIAQWDAEDAARIARMEEYERGYLARLLAKYGPPATE